jgi:putative endonuclease
MLNLFQRLTNTIFFMKTLHVYIMSNYERTTFYIGVTNNLERRIAEHQSSKGSFTSKYKLFYLVYHEAVYGPGNAIRREKQLKNWHREWKLNLIKELNPEMRDLSENWNGKDPETSSG